MRDLEGKREIRGEETESQAESKRGRERFRGGEIERERRE